MCEAYIYHINNTNKDNVMKVQKVEFKSLGLNLVGNLYLPKGFDANQQYKTIIVTPPAHQVKEQTPTVYGPLFANLGFVFFAFDYNSKGESEATALISETTKTAFANTKICVTPSHSFALSLMLILTSFMV